MKLRFPDIKLGFDTEGTPAGGGGDGAPPAVDDGGGNPPSNPAPSDPPAAPVRPDFLPEKFWDAEKGEPRLEGLAKSYGELEKTRGKSLDELKADWDNERLSVRPESADKYELPDSEVLDKEAMANSPVVAVWREMAYAAGLDQEGFSKGLTDYAKVVMDQQEAAKAEEMKALGENAQARIDAVGAWANKNFKDAEFAAIAQIATTAAGVSVLEKFIEMGSSSSPDTGDGAAAGNGELTREEIMKMMSTPEYMDPARQDPALRQKVNEWWAKNGAKSVA